MRSKFPFSMENIPRQRSFACFSLRFGSIFFGLITIFYAMLVIAACGAILTAAHSNGSAKSEWPGLAYFMTVCVSIAHIITLFLSTIMIVGAIRESPCLVRPWVVWVSLQVMVTLLMFILWTTMNLINHFNDMFFMNFVAELLILLIRFYMLMIVGSYYKHLVEERGENERLVTLMNSDTWYSA